MDADEFYRRLQQNEELKKNCRFKFKNALSESKRRHKKRIRFFFSTTGDS